MGRFRNLFRREPTRRELYLQLARGLNIERDYPVSYTHLTLPTIYSV